MSLRGIRVVVSLMSDAVAWCCVGHEGGLKGGLVLVEGLVLKITPEVRYHGADLSTVRGLWWGLAAKMRAGESH